MKLGLEILRKLTDEHGDSFYVVDLDLFRANLRDFAAAFKEYYPRTSLAYSYKTNYTPLLLQVAKQEGCYGEVVSGMEYEFAERVGVPPEKVIFNGPFKTTLEIETALLAGAVVNLDSVAEAEIVADVAKRHQGRPLRVGVRCNFSPGDERQSRFGVSGDELPDVLTQLRSLGECQVSGLHCHFSGAREASSFRTRAETLVVLAKRYWPDSAPPTLNVGGGFFGRMTGSLQKQFEHTVPGYKDYALAVAPVLAKAYPDGEPELILEPGTAVIADVVKFVARVSGVRQIAGRTVATTTGSLQNVKPRASEINLPIRVVPANGPDLLAKEQGNVKLEGPVDIAGYTCMEDDVLYHQYLGPLQVGDFIELSNVGAYAGVFKPPFIRPAPPILAFSSKTEGFQVARRRETTADVLATYCF